MTLLDSLAEWFRNHEALVKECGATVHLSEVNPQTDKPARYADIDLDRQALAGRVTLWVSGECDLEALDAITGHSVHWENVVVHSAAELDATLRRYFRLLLVGKGNRIISAPPN